DKLYFNGQVEVFQITVNEIEGELVNALLSLEYRFNRHIAVGGGYNFYRLDAESDDPDDDFSGLFEFTYQGPTVFVKFGF
ncbi:MAG: hypothetical protein MJA83_01900, partial [Gammaproteobacteria bacterium]|nr:hypothetical protein [Gammaproteobacteria bacterium]